MKTKNIAYIKPTKQWKQMDTLIYCMYVLVDFRILIRKKQNPSKESKQKIVNKIS